MKETFCNKKIWTHLCSVNNIAKNLSDLLTGALYYSGEKELIFRTEGGFHCVNNIGHNG